MPRRQSSGYVPLKPDRVRALGGVEYIKKAEPPERDYGLSSCPLCGRKCRMEVTGNGLYPVYNVVCTWCGCSSGSYRNPVWAAKRWNSRFSLANVSAESSKSVESLESVEPVSEGVTLSSGASLDPVVTDASKAAPKPGRKKSQDLPGQLFFDFCLDGV